MTNDNENIVNEEEELQNTPTTDDSKVTVVGEEEIDFIPPSVKLPISTTTSIHYSEIPEMILNSPQEPIILGVDEAGRGPVLGPMVYGISYCPKSYSETLKKKYGFADSKTLNESKRTQLMTQLCDSSNELFKFVGWACTIMTARDISSGMLKPRHVGNYNLNEQAHDTTMDLIDGILKKGINLKEVYVDTVGPPTTYQEKLKKRFPSLSITVTKKADSLFPIVSTASIVAKVTRDYNLYHSSKGVDWGSGYPGDPRTVKWLNSKVDPVFGWDNNVRFSWQTAKDSLIKNKALEMCWDDDLPLEDDKIDYGNIASMIGGDTKVVDCSWFITGQ
ncbi:hypothetical protein CANARDRAFT_202189 [[Candida] arabinofermentans NRRL YB-2248]|uniref:Ribonuclease n=1 Tax=[Candida] arabinofermentans NRRL YB-2248 TaxID=983967 RepID=A0A1E4SWS9_9ASCO|nr:hypothetical protein CANARDRAFT_202189 [[Candida] arabinofermentans NRRL YB-2248]